MSTKTIKDPKKNESQENDAIFDSGWQVVLYNDDINQFHMVVKWIMQVFGHCLEMATKIALEAHTKGRTIAEVEGHEEAVLHKQQLQSFGLCCEVEKVG